MFSQSLERTLNEAFVSARNKRHEFITLEHLLLALTNNPETSRLLHSCGVDVERLRVGLGIFIDQTTPHIPLNVTREVKPTLGFQRVISNAIQTAQNSGQHEVDGVALLMSLFSEPDSQAVYFLSQENITQADVLNYQGLIGSDDEDGDIDGDGDGDGEGAMGGMSDINRSIQNSFNENYDQKNEVDLKEDEQMIESYATDINAKAAAGEIDPLIGREAEITRALQILCRRHKNNPLFVGESGVGKTAIAHGVAQRIVDKKVPDSLKNCTIYSLDLGVLLAGTKYRGDFEKRFKNILNKLNKKTGAIIFIDEIHNLIGAGSATGGTLDASNLIKPLLSSGDLRCMGATTYEEYRKYFSKDQALSRRFQKIDIEEPDKDETIKILQGLKSRYERYHHVSYTQASLVRAVDLTMRYLPDRFLPDKAIDLIDEAGAFENMKNSKDRSKITEKEIDCVFSSVARVPIKELDASDKKSLRRLPQQLKRLIFGQNEAVERISSAIKLSRLGLGDVERPVGSFLLVGPTGVGKTELLRVLAETLHVSFIRFDMSEYMERHAVSRLIGAPPGYVGYDDGGMLTEAVRKQPHAVLLLDEIEKAHPDIFNILLQIMDYGHLTDSNGRKVDFRHVIVAMTSNVGAGELERNVIGFGGHHDDACVDAAVKQTFSPEFRNRLDSVVHFHYLDDKTIIKVVDKFLGELKKQMKAKKISLVVTVAAKKWIAKTGYDRKMGARPMGRVIQEHLRLPIVEKLLSISENVTITHVKVDAVKSKLIIRMEEDVVA